jgi:4-hydroxybenzoate polyprenyltransferase
MTDFRPADAAHSTLERFLPASFLPFARLARLDRPVGWQLLLIPCLFGEALTALMTNSAPSLWRCLLYCVGSIVMRAAGSAWNDVMDRDIDQQVARTRLRPLAAGTVSPAAALAFIVLLGFIGLAVLLQLSWFAVGVGAASLVLIALYPLAKRVTSHPQVVLGLVFSWGAFMSAADAMNFLGWPIMLLYTAMVAWIIGYDTIYAMQDIEDDAMLGIGSTALAYGKKAHWLVLGCYGATVLLMLGAVIMAGGRAIWLLPGIVVLGCALGWQWLRLVQSGVPAPPATALSLFKSNATSGFLAAAAMLLAALLA